MFAVRIRPSVARSRVRLLQRRGIRQRQARPARRRRPRDARRGGAELPLADLVSIPFFLVVYADRALADPPRLEMELYRGDELRARAKIDTPAPDANGRLTYSGSMNAQRLQPGSCRARIVARQGEMAASNDVSFVIVDRPPIPRRFGRPSAHSALEKVFAGVTTLRERHEVTFVQ